MTGLLRSCSPPYTEPGYSREKKCYKKNCDTFLGVRAYEDYMYFNKENF